MAHAHQPSLTPDEVHPSCRVRRSGGGAHNPSTPRTTTTSAAIGCGYRYRPPVAGLQRLHCRAPVWQSGPMRNQGLIVATLCVIGLAGVPWLARSHLLTPSEASLFTAIDASIAHQPPRAGDIAGAFALPSACHADTCFFKAGSIGDLRYTSGDLRQTPDGLIFVIEGFSNSCIRVDRVRSRFGTAGPEQVCSDAPCWYIETKHSWGFLAFELEKPNSECVSSAVINSTP